MGIFHVQARTDRDKYIDIKWDNIKDDMKHNFKMQKEAVFWDIPYDPTSFMHYESNAFAIDESKPAIVSKVWHT